MLENSRLHKHVSRFSNLKKCLSEESLIIPLEGIQPNEKPKPCRRTNKKSWTVRSDNEIESNSYRESSPNIPKKSRVHLGAGRPDATKISSSLHRVHSKDQQKLNFGTKFLLEGKTVTTRNFRSFFKRRNFIIHLVELLFIIYYSPITIHILHASSHKPSLRVIKFA